MPKRLAGFAIYIIDNKDRDINDFYDVEDEKIGEGSFGRVCKHEAESGKRDQCAAFLA